MILGEAIHVIMPVGNRLESLTCLVAGQLAHAIREQLCSLLQRCAARSRSWLRVTASVFVIGVIH